MLALLDRFNLTADARDPFRSQRRDIIISADSASLQHPFDAVRHFLQEIVEPRRLSNVPRRSHPCVRCLSEGDSDEVRMTIGTSENRGMSRIVPDTSIPSGCREV